MSAIKDNLARVRERIEAAARRVGRDPHTVRLVAVCKTVSPERVKEAVGGSIQFLGENYIQEAQRKIEAMGTEISWHFIGHLQKNKAKYATRLFDLIHSVDSLDLAEELNRTAQKQGKVQAILLQADLSGEETKFGAAEGEIFQMAEQISGLKSVLVRGLMTMPPFSDDPESSRPYFQKLRSLRDKLVQMKISGVFPEELSMGMSGDFEAAIEEGATLVRIGTAIFGPRPPRQ
ncbi:MAG: yggS [Deltaproteobacteria bacterium]|nr:yggS [Deltaproteobacteria bacterium]